MTTHKPDRRNGLEALKRVKSVLTRVGWEPQETSIEGLLRVDFNADNTPIIDAHADVRVDYERFLFYLNFRDRAAPRWRAQAMEFITRANLDLVIGNFELNLNDGSLRFKASVDFTGVRLSEVLIRNLMRSAMDVVEDYAEPAVEVMQGRKTAIEAIADAE